LLIVGIVLVYDLKFIFARIDNLRFGAPHSEKCFHLTDRFSDYAVRLAGRKLVLRFLLSPRRCVSVHAPGLGIIVVARGADEITPTGHDAGWQGHSGYILANLRQTVRGLPVIK
jgi:hypothetical protein